MRYIWILMFVLLACSGQDFKTERAKPKNLLTREQVVKVLVEVNLAEAMVGMANLPYEQSVFRYKKYEKFILKKLQIDSTAFMNSYNFYIQDLDDGDYIYQGVMDSLLLRQARKNID